MIGWSVLVLSMACGVFGLCMLHVGIWRREGITAPERLALFMLTLWAAGSVYAALAELWHQLGYSGGPSGAGKWVLEGPHAHAGWLIMVAMLEVALLALRKAKQGKA